MADSTGSSVGLDNGGNANNATVLDARGPFPRRRAGRECRAGCSRARRSRSRRSPRRFDSVLAAHRGPAAPVRGGRAGHAGPGQRRRRHLLQGLDELLRAGLARLRLPRRARGAARAAGRLQQRRQRGRAVRPLTSTSAPTRPQPVVGVGDRRHRPRRRRDRGGPGHPRRGRHGRRARARARSRWTACSTRASRCRAATAASSATPESVASLTGDRDATCCRTG